MEQVVTFLAVVVGALASVVTTLVVERQKARNEARLRAEEQTEQHRREFHALLIELQQSMNQTLESANDMAYQAALDTDAYVRDEQIGKLDVLVRRSVLLTELLAARLPDDRDRDAIRRFIDEVQSVREHAAADGNAESAAARTAADQAWNRYTEAVERLAVPLREAYSFTGRA